MTIKQEVTRNQARIIVFLSQVKTIDKNAETISGRLQIDYSNCLHLLKGMVELEWLKTSKPVRRTIFELTRKTPVQQARNLITPKGLR